MTAINQGSFHGQQGMTAINQGSFHGQLGMTSIHDESLHALWGIHLGMTQGLLTRMVAYSAPADLRGRAYGFFNLMSGIALLIVSTVAGLLWDKFGPEFTFYGGAGFCVITLMGLVWQPSQAK